MIQTADRPADILSVGCWPRLFEINRVESAVQQRLDLLGKLL